MKKLTKLQLEGLKYGAGEHDIQPSAYIGNTLASHGLLVFVGDRYKGFGGVTRSSRDRAWDITKKGKSILKDLSINA